MPLRIMLVNAPNELNHDQASNCACYPHIGIVQLGTAARAEFGSEVEVEVVDGGISDTGAVRRVVGSSLMNPPPLPNLRALVRGPDATLWARALDRLAACRRQAPAAGSGWRTVASAGGSK
jgi:hypothetical protein